MSMVTVPLSTRNHFPGYTEVFTHIAQLVAYNPQNQATHSPISMRLTTLHNVWAIPYRQCLCDFPFLPRQGPH